MPVRHIMTRPHTLESMSWDGSLTCSAELAAWTEGMAYLVPAGWEHHLRRENEKDRSTGYVKDDASSFICLRTLDFDHQERVELNDVIIKTGPKDFFSRSYDQVVEEFDFVDVL